MRSILFLLTALLLGACGYRGAQTAPAYYDVGQADMGGAYGYSTPDSVQLASEVESVTRNSRREQGRSQGSMAGGMMLAQAMPVAPAPQYTPPAEPVSDGEEASTPGDGLLLIYNGTVVLAVYDVEAKQVEAIALIEAMGGFAAERSAYQLTFRVPAERFRDALDTLGTLGDVLSVDWNADDVTEEYRDLDIRLQNSLQMRARLEELLTRAQTVEEALAIEAELERVTLEIERIRGRLRSLEDLIAYSTIVLSFQQTYVAGVPESEYRLPFNWLNTLGLPNLLSLY